MGFHVSPDFIAQYGSIVKKQEQHSGAAQRYAEQNLTIGPGEGGWITLFTDTHDEVRSQVIAAMSHLKEVCGHNSLALDNAAEFYRSTDEGVARHLDDLYPGVARPPLSPSSGSLAFKEKEATGRLTPPGEPKEFNDPFIVINTISNFISPGYWVQEVLKETIGYNPVDHVSTLISGDWVGLAKCSSAFNSLSFFCSDVSVNIKENHQVLLNTWGGNAADKSSEYFLGLANSLDDHKRVLEALRDAYENAAVGAWEFSKMIGDKIQGFFDEVFWLAVRAASAAVLSVTVVGALAFWSMAAFQCAQIIARWKDLVRLFEKAQNFFRGIHGGMLAILGTSGAFTAHPLPAGSYRHPAEVKDLCPKN